MRINHVEDDLGLVPALQWPPVRQPVAACADFLLSHLSLPPAQHLQVLSSCCKVLLEGTPEASKSLQWMQCNQVRAVEWGAGCLKL